MSQDKPEVNPYETKPDPYQAGPPPRTSGKAIGSLILGLLSFVMCILTGLPAIILGFISRSDIAHSDGQLKGGGMATTGIVLGFISVAGLLVLPFMALPVALLLPAINAAREAARRNGCLNNMRQVGLATANHEAAATRLPLVNHSPYDLQTVVPGQARGAAGDDGYSFLVTLLPYIEESILFGELKQSSEKFSRSAFDGQLLSSSGEHFAEVQISAFRCPSFSGDDICRDDAQYPVPAAVGNYGALVATDFAPGAAGGNPAPWKANYPTWENGVIVSRCADAECQFKGVGLRQIGDGISKTVICSETRERRFGSWYSGGSTWLVAVTNQSAPSQGVQRAPDGFVELTHFSDSLALNWGDRDTYATGISPGSEGYLKAGQNWPPPPTKDRVFGPSSEHAGNVILHVYADAHAQAIRADCDPTVYLRLITRDDGDPVNADLL